MFVCDKLGELCGAGLPERENMIALRLRCSMRTCTLTLRLEAPRRITCSGGEK